MLELRDISVIHGIGKPNEIMALERLDLHASAGEFITIVGSNGAGKSSLVRVIAGAEKPTYGRVYIDGRDVTKRHDYQRAHLVARVFDNPEHGTVADFSIEENLALAMRRGHSRAFLKAVTRSRREQMRDAVAELGLGLEDRLSDRVGLLSAGQRQSLTLVMSAMTSPKILLLDEHVAALDPNTQYRVVQLTVQIVERLGCTALMITHNMRHALDLGQRLIVMSRGQIIGDFSSRAKAQMTVDDVITHITRAGDVVPDRSLLVEPPG